MYASLAAPLLGVIPSAPNVIIDWSGETSRGKTTTLRVAASVWGVPDLHSIGLVRTWDVSPAALEVMASTLHCLPLILDDTKRATTRGNATNIVASLIYQMAAGQGRGRGRPDGMRRTSEWRAITLSTGEAPATSFTPDAGSRARVLCITGSPLPPDSSALVARLTARLLEHHGHAGPRFVQHLLNTRERWDELRRRYADSVAYWTAAAGGSPVAARLAQTLALLDLGRHALHEVLRVPHPPEHAHPLKLALIAAGLSAEDADRPAAALAALYRWAAAHPDHFYGRQPDARAPHGGWVGSWLPEATEIAFMPEPLHAILRELGFHPDDVIERWFERGVLRYDDKHRGHKRRVGTLKARCFVFRCADMTDAEDRAARRATGAEPPTEASEY